MGRAKLKPGLTIPLHLFWVGIFPRPLSPDSSRWRGVRSNHHPRSLAPRFAVFIPPSSPFLAIAAPVYLDCHPNSPVSTSNSGGSLATLLRLIPSQKRSVLSLLHLPRRASQSLLLLGKEQSRTRFLVLGQGGQEVKNPASRWRRRQRRGFSWPPPWLSAWYPSGGG